MNPGIVIAARLGTKGGGGDRGESVSCPLLPPPRLGLLPAPSLEAALPGLMRLMWSLQIHLRFLDAVITAAPLPSQPLPLAGQTAGCGDVALAAWGVSGGGRGWAGPSQQARSCSEAQADGRAGETLVTSGFSLAVTPGRLLGCGKCPQVKTSKAGAAPWAGSCLPTKCILGTRVENK